ncbi:unnamed protein product [Sphenostylis stenocarpa]|uniref:non-specific serine/threonine protein kinase n=1 Tax=Sphenostylis stenocarpa TaxID=92480 RepID=A0AA86S4W2_9FABA|nr:unnamed protein product [Sphenostylis stenocarpa]
MGLCFSSSSLKNPQHSGNNDGEGFLPLPPPDGRILKWPNLVVFSYEDLKYATRNFKSDTLIGEGGFGRVYKGWLDENTLTPTKPGSGIDVAIKKFNKEGLQGFQQWQSEITFFGRLSHPNLVNLLGYCWDEDEFLLVYEFMPYGSLENHLFSRDPDKEPLSWSTRLKIVIGAARGLTFLHASENQVIHRDVKCSNILLDANYDAKLSDFGLARSGPSDGKNHVSSRVMSLGPSEGNTHVTTTIMGTYAYVAPGYKSDVYGFGVVLLEILTGMRALDPERPSGQQILVEWTKPCLSSKKKLKTIMDGRIEGQYSPKAAFEAAQLTLKCLGHDPNQRPSMKEVLEGLEAIQLQRRGGVSPYTCSCCPDSDDLKYVTRNFMSDALIDQGGFGRVYEGWLDENTLTPTEPGSGIVAAIKMFNKEGLQGFLIVVGNPYKEPLSWNTRLKIAIDAARGLAFLHASEKQVIHKDFKPSNILLDGVS